jgi:hypothetical protein
MAIRNSTTQPHAAVNNPSEQPAIAALIAFAAQRSGIDRNNYYSPWDSVQSLRNGLQAFKEEHRDIRADLKRLREALSIAAVEGVTDADLVAESPHAYSGRLSWIVGEARCRCSYAPPVSKHSWEAHYSGKAHETCGNLYRLEAVGVPYWSYCAGQYFPTEYRKAAVKVLEAATRRVRQARPPETAERITSVAQLRDLNERNGGCWFSRSTMRFHGTTIQSGIIHGEYFLTLDKRGFDESAGYGYTVRTFNSEGDVRTSALGNRSQQVGSFDSKREALDALSEHLGGEGRRV